MSILRRLFITMVALVALAALAVVALVTLDLGALRPAFARWASGQIERDLALDGPVSLHVGRTVRLSAKGIRLANVTWGSRGDMLTVAHLTVEIDAWSLVRQPVIVRRVTIEGLDLLLERNADGADNWEFGAEDDEPFRWPESLPVVVEEVSMPGARLGFIGPRLQRPLDLRFERLDQRRAAGGMLKLDGNGLANETDLDLHVEAGPFPHLIEGRDFSIAVDAKLGEVALEGRLRIDDIAKPVDTTLGLKVRGPDADYLASRFGVRNLGAGPLALDAFVRPAAAGGGIEGELTGSVGQFTLAARGELADPAHMGKARLQLEISGPDLSFAGGLAGVDRLPADSFQLKAALDRIGERLRIEEATLALADSHAELSGTIEDIRAMTGYDLRFNFKGSELARFRSALSLPDGMSGTFDMSVRVRKDGSEDRIELQSTTALGTLQAAGVLGSYPDYHGTRLRIDASGPSLVSVGQVAGVAGLPAADFVAGGNVEWSQTGALIRGGTLRAGPDRLGLDGRIAREPLGPGTDVTWTARGPDLGLFAAAFGVQGAPAGAFDLGGRLRREAKASRLDKVTGTFNGATVNFSGRIADTPTLGTNLQFSVAGPRLEAFAWVLPDYPLPPGKFTVAGQVTLTAERVTVRQLRWSAARSEGTADVDVVLPLSATRGRFTVAASGPDLAPFVPRPGTARQSTGPFELQLRGEADGGSWRFDDARLTAGVGSISASGKLDWAPDFSATAIKAEIRAPDLSAAGRLLGLDLPAQPLELTAEFTGTPTAFRVERGRGRLGSTDFDGRMQLDLRARPVLDLDFRSDLLDLTPFMGPTTPGPAVAPAPRQKKERLIPDSPITLTALNRLDASIDIRATRALVADFALDDLRVAARLQGGALSIDSLELKAPPDGRLTLTGRVAPGARGAAIQLSASGTRVSLAGLDDTPAQRATRPRGDMQFELAGEGATWSELARSLNGGLRVTTGSGAIPAARLSLLFGNVLRDILAKAVPGANPTDQLGIRCLAAFVTVTDGVVHTSPALVMQTRKVNAAVQGSANLGTEKLEFYLRTAPLRGSVNVSVGEVVTPYLMITGTLAHPGVSVDPKGALFTGGAAFATAGISILAKTVWDRVFQAGDPCAVATAEADKLARERAEPQKKSVLQKLRGR